MCYDSSERELNKINFIEYIKHSNLIQKSFYFIFQFSK